ncbi:WSC domain protein [Paraphaeosphaeria sporulosa]
MKMHWTTSTLVALAFASPISALIRFQCSQLVVERLDPLVTPGQVPSPHVHQIVGGNSFNATMAPSKDMPGESTCTTCQFSEDFSNYWTAILYFRARNGTYKRVPQRSNAGFDGTTGGGMTVYYMTDPLYDSQPKSKVSAFKPGFRMFVGDINARTKEQAARFRQLTYTCMENAGSREHEVVHFPQKPCSYGIMTSVRFPTCWDGVNLDSPDHMAHMSYPESGTFESAGPCPSTHPVRVSQVLFEVIWDTSKFNDPADWPEDGSQPFVWSFGDPTGYANHADYVFGWKDDSLQKILDTSCYATSCGGKQQSIAEMNKCAGLKKTVDEDIGEDTWLTQLPGGHAAE